jgi:hypothetical protein
MAAERSFIHESSLSGSPGSSSSSRRTIAITSARWATPATTFWCCKSLAAISRLAPARSSSAAHAIFRSSICFDSVRHFSVLIHSIGEHIAITELK